MLSPKLTSWCGAWEFVPQLDEVFHARLAAGTASEEELSALTDIQSMQVRRLKRVPDVFGMLTGPFIISPRMRAFLDEHEPSVHRYFPIRITATPPKDGKTEHGTHWLLFPPPRIDCLNFELTIFVDDAYGKAWSRDRTDTNIYGGGAWGSGLREDGTRPPRRCVLDGKDLGGRHLWRVATGNSPIYSKYTCSPEFWSFYRASKMTGWQIDITCEVL
jgi:hypothetical protein